MSKEHNKFEFGSVFCLIAKVENIPLDVSYPNYMKKILNGLCLRVAVLAPGNGRQFQSYEIKSPPWNFLWFRILGIFSVGSIDRLGVFMFQT